MIWNPAIGKEVQIWYAEAKRRYVTLHGRVGWVRAVGLGKGPRNVHVEIDGVGYVVPRGNLRKVVRP